ncbi:MAG TPA: Hsp20/alpha crystallin family protein [Thermodesulfovibrionales bacterium]|nr:Hsp20/alpha crystallin family protein [Thermodesulfovibrionales bacterium]
MVGHKGTTELVTMERPRHLLPFEEMERWVDDLFMRPFPMLARPLWREMELGEFETGMPSVDIYEDGHEVVLKADLPGIDKKDIDVNIGHGFLTISGERKKEEKVEKGNYYRYERTHGSFFRRFELPPEIDTDKIRAHFEKGVLEVRIPKSVEAKVKTKKITIS